MLNLIFLSAKTFLNKEVLAALRRNPDIRTLSVSIPLIPQPADAAAIFQQLAPYLPAIVVSLNDGGYDQSGALASLLCKNGSYLVNWYYDDPTYEQIFYKRIIPDFSKRIDFVSEATFVPALGSNGRIAHFLPLATDPEFFNTDAECSGYKYDIAFVGNSSLSFLDSIAKGDLQNDLERHTQLLADIAKAYRADPRADLYALLANRRSEWKTHIKSSADMFTFTMVWMAGYLYRKEFVTDLAHTYKNRFTCFGDIYWTQFLPASQVSTDAMYYTNLCSYYRSTKINININRIQTRTSFTQRVFDCKASGAFLLTDKREMNARFFTTSGPRQDIVEYDSLSHCKKLIDYYLIHTDEREQIARAGREQVLQNHTYDNRIAELLAVCRKTWGI